MHKACLHNFFLIETLPVHACKTAFSCRAQFYCWTIVHAHGAVNIESIIIWQIICKCSQPNMLISLTSKISLKPSHSVVYLNLKLLINESRALCQSRALHDYRVSFASKVLFGRCGYAVCVSLVNLAGPAMSSVATGWHHRAWRGEDKLRNPDSTTISQRLFMIYYNILVINLICPLHLLLFVPRCLHLLYMGRFHCVKEEAIRQLHVDYSLFNIFSNYINYNNEMLYKVYY